VGKRGGCKSTPQAFIEKLMVSAVNEGETVVRLKAVTPSSLAAVARKLSTSGKQASK
jgi:siroheme synthase